MVGYQGLSERPSSHRQSGASGRATQTATPNAPAKWAVAVSEVITRSRLAITAAVSKKGPLLIQFGRKVRDGERDRGPPPVARCRRLSAGSASELRESRQRGETAQGNGAETIAAIRGVSLPSDADLETRQSDQPRPPGLQQRRSGHEDRVSSPGPSRGRS